MALFGQHVSAPHPPRRTPPSCKTVIGRAKKRQAALQLHLQLDTHTVTQARVRQCIVQQGLQKARRPPLTKLGCCDGCWAATLVRVLATAPAPGGITERTAQAKDGCSARGLLTVFAVVDQPHRNATLARCESVPDAPLRSPHRSTSDIPECLAPMFQGRLHLIKTAVTDCRSLVILHRKSNASPPTSGCETCRPRPVGSSSVGKSDAQRSAAEPVQLGAVDDRDRLRAT
ncbi:hypothetical protein K456DRAFT_1059442 [Colletotrichum gloeosporioides 23]|nr:hypothetical protein K456DRAFT_1059442 [Colletotrichum gloeosporioides 23]